VFETTVTDGVLGLHRPETRWLSTGWEGGFERAKAAYNVTVPEGWERTDLGAYIAERRERAGFTVRGPTLLTGVEMQHARGARLDPVVAYATVGLSNPAALPTEPTGTEGGTAGPHSTGTVNLIVGTTQRLDEAALANLLSVVVEAKTATLLAEAGFPGTTTDAVVVGSTETGEPATFSGSATPVGAAARACVREAVRASFRSRYAERAVPRSVEDAEHGVVTDQRAEVFTP
jgi:adenosylcobinamide hydrolase